MAVIGPVLLEYLIIVCAEQVERRQTGHRRSSQPTVTANKQLLLVDKGF